MSIRELAHLATAALLAQTPVTVTHPAGWKREGFPLPMKRQAPDTDGSVSQHYRPLAILEYVNEMLNGEIAARRVRDRAESTPQPADISDLA